MFLRAVARGNGFLEDLKRGVKHEVKNNAIRVNCDLDVLKAGGVGEPKIPHNYFYSTFIFLEHRVVDSIKKVSFLSSRRVCFTQDFTKRVIKRL